MRANFQISGGIADARYATPAGQLEGGSSSSGGLNE